MLLEKIEDALAELCASAGHVSDGQIYDAAKAVLRLVDERIDEWLEGIDCAAEQGSAAAARDGALIGELQAALLEGVDD
jgi:hypothetical protein